MNPPVRVAAALVVLCQLPGCTGNADPTVVAGPNGASVDRRTEPSGASAPPGDPVTHPPEEPSATTAPRRDERSRHSGHRAGKLPSLPDSLATGSSVVVDPAGDAAGDPAPPHAEIVGASVKGRGDTATFVLKVDGPIPTEVANRDNVIAGIGIEYKGRMGGIALVAQGTRDGWVAGIQREGRYRELRKGWKISGNRFVWAVPWREVGRARSFRWGASLRWFHFGSDDPNEAEQSHDRVPESEPAVYPADT